MTREGIERKIESILQKMKELKMLYSDYEDQLSDLRGDLATIEREENASNGKEEE